MLCESKVPGVVSGDSHHGACTVSDEDVVTDPYRDLSSCDGMNCIATREDSGDGVIHHTLPLRSPLGALHVGIHRLSLLGSSHLVHQRALRSEYHKGYSVQGIRTGGEDRDRLLAIGKVKNDLRPLRSTDPVSLSLLDRRCPVYILQPGEKPLSIRRDTQTPLLHNLLLYRMTSTYRQALAHFVVGEHSPQSRTPVDHRLTTVCESVIHQHLLLLSLAPLPPFISGKVQILRSYCMEPLCPLLSKVVDQSGDRLSLIQLRVVVGVKHLYERPLSPPIVLRITGHNHAAPVVREANVIQLLAVPVGIDLSGKGRMLSCLYGVLLCRESISIVSHGM